MLEYASKKGQLIDGFTGEHVGEPCLLICLLYNPLLHVDIKFLTPYEFRERVENPVVLWEKENILSEIINTSMANGLNLTFNGLKTGSGFGYTTYR